MSIGVKENKSVTGVLTFLGDNPTVIDVGSNKGQWADIILNRFGDNCNIHLLEPNEMLLNYTRIKYEYNKNINYCSLAAYKEITDLQFYFFENYNNELSSIYRGNDWEDLPIKEKTVKTTTIEKYSNSNNLQYINYLKIDTEGADVDVLLGCKELMIDNKIGIIQLEYGSHYIRANHKFDEIISIAEETNYDIYYWDGNNYIKVSRESFVEDFRAEDFFLTRFNIANYSVGWNNQFILNTALLGKFDLVLELGTFEGLNVKYICENLLNDGGRVIVIDPLENYYTKEDTEHTEIFKDQYQRFLRNTYGLPIELKKNESDIVLPKLHELRFGLIYIDGSHTEEQVYKDGCNCFKICKNGGKIIFDDYTWREETKRGIDRFLLEHQRYITIISKDYQVVIEKIIDK